MKISYTIKIEQDLAEKIRTFCFEHGLKEGFFVEKALKEQLTREEMSEDLLNLKNLRAQEAQAISFEDYLKKRSS